MYTFAAPVMRYAKRVMPTGGVTGGVVPRPESVGIMEKTPQFPAGVVTHPAGSGCPALLVPTSGSSKYSA